MAQYQRDLPRRADMRVHDPVDERRGLGVGRQGLEEVGEVGTVGHVGAQTGDHFSHVKQRMGTAVLHGSPPRDLR